MSVDIQTAVLLVNLDQNIGALAFLDVGGTPVLDESLIQPEIMHHTHFREPGTEFGLVILTPMRNSVQISETNKFTKLKH